MKIDGNAIRPGMVIEHKGDLWLAVKIQHTQPGKGGAYLQVELKGVRTGTKLNERFRSSESVERVRLEQKLYQYLFSDNGLVTVMDGESFEQSSFAESLLGDALPFLQDGMMIDLKSYEGEVISATLPETVVVTVQETEPTVKGQTAASSNKPAVLENGVRIMVPPFVAAGERILVNTSDATYVRRAED
ncbi:MAG: elongation factor P [Proteobacteria bacterium]|nr:elongation factor P [Pseudomonadota bacterium]MDA1133282.1 elongation factor P [Pseudomonadota bacterium]